MHQLFKFISGTKFYNFRTVSLSIIRSLALYTQQQAHVIHVMLTAYWWDQDENGSSSILILLASSQHNLYDMGLLLFVQCYTLDDGQRNCPKPLEFCSRNKFEKLVHPVGFVVGK